MKKTLLFFLLSGSILTAQTSSDGWINEIHYDNASADQNEFIEVVIKDVSTYPAANWTITLYNGTNNSQYPTNTDYAGNNAIVTSTTVNGVTILDFAFPANGLENGTKDAISLDYNNTVVQFLSYEGSMTASNGVASGMTSNDIGVRETSSTPAGHSLQLAGIGESYNDFKWQEAATDTDGAFNNSQEIVSTSTALTIASGKSLSIYNTVQVASLNNSGTLTIVADENGYGQLKVTGTIANSGTITQQQYIPSLGHHGISSSMSNGFNTTTGDEAELYAYNSATGAYNTSPATNSAGIGYFAPVQASNGFISSEGAFSVTGTPNTAHTWSLGYASNQASGGSGSGWNLIGNPYTASLDWTTVDLTGKSINNAIYLWDADNESYDYYVNGVSAPSGTYAGSAISNPNIAPLQAFWVQTTASGQTLATTMSANTIVSASPTFYKTTNPNNLIFIVEDLNDQSKGDVMWLKDVAGTNEGFDAKEDAWKLMNQGGNPNLYTANMGEKIAINAIDLSSPTVIPMNVEGAETSQGIYRVSFEEVAIDDSYSVILEDKLFNSFTDLNQQTYTFQFGSWHSSGSRFNLHINRGVKIGLDENDVSKSYAYSEDNVLNVVTDPSLYSQLTITSVTGQRIFEKSIVNEKTTIDIGSKGVFIITLTGQENSHSFKTLIE